MQSFRLLQKQLLVRNLPNTFTEEDFKKAFDNPVKYNIPKFQNGRFKRFGFVTVDDDKAASYLNGVIKVNNIEITVEVAGKGVPTQPNKLLYVANLPISFDSFKLKYLFKDMVRGEVKKSKIDQKLFAIVEFSDLEASSKALKVSDKTIVEGNEISVSYVKYTTAEKSFTPLD